MTKKDYELIARVLRSCHYAEHSKQGQVALEALAETLADSLQDTNPRFDRNKFLTACGIETKSFIDKLEQHKADSMLYQ